jgi:hypothetical protein
MTLGKLSLGFAAVALMAAPVVAQSNFAPVVAPLSGEETGVASETVIIGVVVAAAVVGGIFALSGEDEPLSP